MRTALTPLALRISASKVPGICFSVMMKSRGSSVNSKSIPNSPFLTPASFAEKCRKETESVVFSCYSSVIVRLVNCYIV